MPLNKIQQEKIKKRNEEIKYLHEVKGFSFRRIGAIYNISYERARQVCAEKKGAVEK